MTAEDDLYSFETPDEALQYLRYAGMLDDDVLDVGEAALALALVFLPGVHIDRYRQHLARIKNDVRETWRHRLDAGAKDTAALRAGVLRTVLHDRLEYKGDNANYDDLENGNMIRVIERRRGLPVALGLLYLIVGHALGWQVEGLNFPGHFLVRLEHEGERLILDPFAGGEEKDAAQLRQLLKSIAGKKAELAHEYYETVTSRDALIRLQNNLKARLIETEEYAQAILVIETMEALGPGEYRTLFDKAVLYVKVGQHKQALTALDDYIAKNPNAQDQQYAKLLAAEIRATFE
ncbi:MAG: transglutaminase-like domain-containing protein [Alphaproteobacteria bacterium]|nr:transglutaminase-like domain-containing protein [Alphaproteobacteria bacterium]